MSNQILLVEDDPAVLRLVSFLLKNEGFEVAAHEDVGAARAAIGFDKPDDLVLLDLMLPDLDGIEFERELRARAGFERVPILALSARDQTVDRYEAYRAGFDGYVIKSFDPLELLFSIRAYLRLANPGDESSVPDMGLSAFRLSPAKLTVETDRVEFTLTRLETAVLHYLMKRPREVFSADELAEAVLLGAQGRTRTVDAVHAHIRNLRTKLETDPKEPMWIKTMGRRGYFFSG